MASTTDPPARAPSRTPEPAGPGNGAASPGPTRGGPPSSAPATPSPHPATVGDPPPRGGRLVGVILGGVVASALVMATFIWYRWQAVREPTTVVIVTGDAALAGAVVHVDTVGRDHLESVTLSADNNYTASVLLEPGWYSVSAERHGVVVLPATEVEVRRFLGVRFNLAGTAPPATRPTAAATPQPDDTP